MPRDRRLIVDGSGEAENRDSVAPELFVPLGLLRKEPLRRFDAEIASEGPLLIADRIANGKAMTFAIAAALELESGKYPAGELMDAIERISCDPLDSHPERLAQRLIEDGTFNEQQVIVGLELGPIVQSLLAAASQNFLLAGYISPALQGMHRLIKYSYAWRLEDKPVVPYLPTIFACFGLADIKVGIELNSSLMYPRSYHVEVHVPPQLVSVGLTTEPVGSGHGNDRQVNGIAHAVVPANAMDVPDSATLKMRLAPPPLLALAAIGGLFTAVILILGLYLPERFAHLTSGNLSLTIGIYLAIPGLFIVGLSRSSENPVVSTILGPLRGSLWVLVGCLFASGGVLAFGMGAAEVAITWNISAFVGLVIGGMSLIGYINCRTLSVDRS